MVGIAVGTIGYGQVSILVGVADGVITELEYIRLAILQVIFEYMGDDVIFEYTQGRVTWYI